MVQAEPVFRGWLIAGGRLLQIHEAEVPGATAPLESHFLHQSIVVAEEWRPLHKMGLEGTAAFP